jgi:hypothetical protein
LTDWQDFITLMPFFDDLRVHIQACRCGLSLGPAVSNSIVVSHGMADISQLHTATVRISSDFWLKDYQEKALEIFCRVFRSRSIVESDMCCSKNHILSPLGITSLSFYLTPDLKDRVIQMSFRGVDGKVVPWADQYTLPDQDPSKGEQ